MTQRCLCPHRHPLGNSEPPQGWLGMHYIKLLCLLKMNMVARNPLGLGRASVTDHFSRGKEPVCVCCLRMLIYAEPGKRYGSSALTRPEVLSTSSCTFVGRGRREIQWVLRSVPEHRLTPRSHPTLSRAPPAPPTPEPKKVLGHIGLEPAFFSLISPSSHSTPLLFFPEMNKVSWSNSLTAIDHIFQTQN